MVNDEQLLCEAELRKKECLEALKSMAPDKSPGTDVLPCEFYKVLWNDAAESLIKYITYSYEMRKLSISQSRGIIKLIPKKAADLNLMKNWRPLTLLSCKYKMATKDIPNRIKTFLPKLVCYYQTGFIRDRFIGENIGFKNMPGLLLFLNFEKAFFNLEWPFISKTVQYFGLGPSFLNWLIVFYCNSQGCILNNGLASTFFVLYRGVRQGCTPSPYLFVLFVEVLANAMRQKKKTKQNKTKTTKQK